MPAPPASLLTIVTKRVLRTGRFGSPAMASRSFVNSSSPPSRAIDVAHQPCEDSVAAPTAFPDVGLAVRDSDAWCAELPARAKALAAGQRMTLVLADSESATVPASLDVTAKPRTAECHAEIAQSRWVDYVAYDLTVVGAAGAGTDLPAVALAAVGESRWQRAANGRVRADLDGDGVPRRRSPVPRTRAFRRSLPAGPFRPPARAVAGCRSTSIGA